MSRARAIAVLALALGVTLLIFTPYGAGLRTASEFERAPQALVGGLVVASLGLLPGLVAGVRVWEGTFLALGIALALATRVRDSLRPIARLCAVDQHSSDVPVCAARDVRVLHRSCAGSGGHDSGGRFGAAESGRMTSSSSRGADVITEIRSTPRLADGSFGFSARARWLASLVFFGLFPALVLVGIFVAATADDAVATDFLQFYGAARGDPRRRRPVSSDRRADDAWGGPYPYPPLPALARGSAHRALARSCGAARHGCARRRRARGSVRPRRARLALLRAAAAVAAGDLGDPDRERDALVRAGSPRSRGGSATALAPVLREHRRHARGEVLPLAARRLARRDAAGSQRALSRVCRRGRRCSSRRGPRSASRASPTTRTPARLEDTVGADSYTAYIVGLDLGLPSSVARAVWLAVGLARCSPASSCSARRGDERTAFIVAIAASLALTPIVWLHYFALLLVVVALAQPRLGLLWFVPLGDGAHAGERASDAVPDRVDAGCRRRHRRARAVRESRGRRGARPAARLASSSGMTLVGRGRSSRQARLDARHVARARAWTLTVWVAMTAWSAVLFVDRARELRELPRGPLRPREHGAGGLEHGARASARDHARRDRRADGSARRARRSVPRAARAALDRVALAARARRSRRSSSCRSVRCPCSGSAGATSARRRRPALLALGYLAYPWTATSAAASIHPVTFAIPLFLFCIWFLDTDRLVPFAIFAVLAMSTGELMGLPIAALGIWYALARGGDAPGRWIALAGAAWTFVAVYVVVPAFSGEDSMFFGFYDEVGGSPVGRRARRCSPIPATVLGALVEGARHRLPRLARAPAPVPLRALAGARRGRAAAAARERALGLPLDDGPAYHCVAAVIPFLSPRRCSGSRGSARRGARSRPRPCSCARRRSRSSSGRGRAPSARFRSAERVALCRRVARARRRGRARPERRSP